MGRFLRNPKTEVPNVRAINILGPEVNALRAQVDFGLRHHRIQNFKHYLSPALLNQNRCQNIVFEIHTFCRLREHCDESVYVSWWSAF